MEDLTLTELGTTLAALISEAWGWHGVSVSISETSIFALSQTDKKYATFRLGDRINIFILYDDLVDYLRAQILLNSVESLKGEWEETPNDPM